MSLTRIGLFLFFISQLNPGGFAQSEIITTYAGPQLPATGAHTISQAIDGPFSIAPDGSGGFYLASQDQNRVYRVASDGMMSLIAGNGTSGYSGDGGRSTTAQLNNPWGGRCG